MSQNHALFKPLVDKTLDALQLGPEAFSPQPWGARLRGGCRRTAMQTQTETWIKQYENNIINDKQIVFDYGIAQKRRGVGILEAPRGAGPSHWLQRTIRPGWPISSFVVPTTWNLSPRDENVPALARKLFAGTPVADPARPVEILRVVHSF